jgi:hypothetical protein
MRIVQPPKSTPETVKQARDELWAAEEHADPLPVKKSPAERRDTRDTWLYGLVVVGILVVACAYVFWWSWK